MERRALSKRLRFEIFKRDGFRCVYCGITAMNSVMHIDHVKPVADGGTDDPANLVTACRDCNGGKSAVPLEQRRLKSAFTSDEEREYGEQLREYLTAQREIVGIKKDAEVLVLERWQDLMGDLPNSLPRYVPGAIREHGLSFVLEAVEIVARKGIDGLDSVRYFCGILRRRRLESNPEPAKLPPECVGALDALALIWGRYFDFIAAFPRRKCEEFFVEVGYDAESLECVADAVKDSSVKARIPDSVEDRDALAAEALSILCSAMDEFERFYEAEEA